jgi:hypothetical protein
VTRYNPWITLHSPEGWLIMGASLLVLAWLVWRLLRRRR